MSSAEVRSPSPPDAERRCERCGAPLQPSRRKDARYCGSGCRGVSSRKRKAAEATTASQGSENVLSPSQPGAAEPDVAPAVPAPRVCELDGCSASLADLRPSARYCSSAHRTAAYRERARRHEADVNKRREHTRLVRRAAAARRRAERSRLEAEEQRQRELERRELDLLRAENERLRAASQAAAHQLQPDR